MDKIRQWLYYLVIGIISFVALVFLPFVGSTIDAGWNLPSNEVGWVVFITTKLIVAIINVLLFHCFMLQAKINVKDNEHYKAANDIVMKVAPKIYTPRSPREFNKKEYMTKGVTIFITTIFSAFALTQAVLTFDYVSLLTYLFTIILGVVMGILQMKKAETYWTTEFYDYAMKLQENLNKGAVSNDNDRQQDLQELGRTSPKE